MASDIEAESLANEKRKLSKHVPVVVENQSWEKIKRQKREQHKLWKEQNLMKKLKKKEEKTETTEDNTELTHPEISGRRYSLSVAVPASIVDNAQSNELQTYLIGQIARAAVIFNVDEIVVFDDQGTSSKNLGEDEEEKANASCARMARVLRYLECPQYLRKHFFPLHSDLKYAGLLNPLDAPHHLRADEDNQFREGIVTNKLKQGRGSYADVGLRNQDVLLDKVLQPGIRVTIKMLPTSGKKRKGVVVDPNYPRREFGSYWGYNVRVASCLASVISNCPFVEGYDVTVGTSDKGQSIREIQLEKSARHLLVVFGGLKGLESCVDADERLPAKSPEELFNFYVNSCVNQGSRTIRTEEAILITLSSLQLILNQQQS